MSTELKDAQGISRFRVGLIACVLSSGFKDVSDGGRRGFEILHVNPDSTYGSFRKLGVLYLGVYIIRILLFRVLD